jgi:hypothetical protein
MSLSGDTRAFVVDTCKEYKRLYGKCLTIVINVQQPQAGRLDRQTASDTATAVGHFQKRISCDAAAGPTIADVSAIQLSGAGKYGVHTNDKTH